MRPDLRDLAVLEYVDNVSILDGTETVSYSECDPIADFGRLVQCILDDLLTLRVQRTGCLVKEENLGVADKSPCDSDALPLPAR